MKIPYYQIDSFTNILFRGNPAGVCILDEWLNDNQLKSIASENNLSETAFIIDKKSYYELRWFTPETEIDLCGHATLASAFVIFNFLDTAINTVDFKTKSGLMKTSREDKLISLYFPSRKAVTCPVPDNLIKGLGITPEEVFKSRDYLVVYNSEDQIKSIEPDFDLLMDLDCIGIIVTSKGNTHDFVSRFFAPKAGIPEDPVTGSAHCTLIPYWAEKLNKKKLHAKQLSKREGELFCEDSGKTVKISGEAVLYSEGFIIL